MKVHKIAEIEKFPKVPTSASFGANSFCIIRAIRIVKVIRVIRIIKVELLRL